MSIVSYKCPVPTESSCSPTLRRMTLCWEMLTLAILLLCSAVPLACGQTVKGIEGQPATLPCSYRIKQSSDITAMCWGRGACPNSKCNGLLIWTDGHKVTYRSSERYQLNGRIPRGDISLTIDQASMTDGGTYCCRIEHRGWFNDEKINIQLNMEQAPTTPPPTTPVTSTTPPPILMTTLLPTMARATTLPNIPAITTMPPPTQEETTQPPTTALQSTPAGTTPELSAVTTSSPLPTAATVSWPLPESTTTPPTTIPSEWITTRQQSLGTDSDVTDSSTHENTPEATVPHNPTATLPSQPASDKNGITDLFSANTTVVEKENNLPLHILIIAICLFVIAVALAAMFFLNLRWKKRGRYPVGFDPNLELVAHAEEPLPETEAEISQTVTLETCNGEANKAKTSEQQMSNETEDQ